MAPWSRLDKIGSYDVAQLLREARQRAPLQTPGYWLYGKTLDKLLATEQEALRFVLSRQQPVEWAPLARVTLLSPTLVDLSFSTP